MTPFVDAVLGQAAAPYLCVYTDTDDRVAMTGVAEIYNGEFRQLNLAVEIGIASAVKDPDGDIVIQMADTDEGMELAVDVMETQVKAALFGDTTSEWGELVKRFMRNVTRVTSRRGGQVAQGLRFAARRVVFVGKTIDDIAPGVVPSDKNAVWKFISMAEASDPSLGIQNLGTVVNNLISQNASANAPDWRIAQTYLGITTRAAMDLNLPNTPLPWPQMETPPLDWSDQDEYVPQLGQLTVNGPTVTTDIFPMARRRVVRRGARRMPPRPEPPKRD